MIQRGILPFNVSRQMIFTDSTSWQVKQTRRCTINSFSFVNNPPPQHPPLTILTWVRFFSNSIIDGGKNPKPGSPTLFCWPYSMLSLVEHFKWILFSKKIKSLYHKARVRCLWCVVEKVTATFSTKTSGTSLFPSRQKVVTRLTVRITCTELVTSQRHFPFFVLMLLLGRKTCTNRNCVYNSFHRELKCVPMRINEKAIFEASSKLISPLWMPLLMLIIILSMSRIYF